MLHQQSSALNELGEALHARGHSVSAFSDAAAALKAFTESVFPIVLAGGESGGDFIREVRAMPGGNDCIILAVSSNHDQAVGFVDAGADDYVHAEVPRELLQRRIAVAEALAACTGERRLPPEHQLLSEVARVSAELLQAPVDQSLPLVLAALGQAIDVDRAYCFKDHPHPGTGEPAATQLHEWTRTPDLAEIDNPQLQDMLYSDMGLTRWHRMFQERNSIQSIIRELPAEERVIMEEQNILSIAVFPVRVAGELWGFIGFDDCRTERRWSLGELAAVEVAATAIGHAIEREQANEAVRRSEERFRDLLEHLVDIVYRHDRDGRIIDVNDAGCAALGYTREELLGKHVLDLVAPYDHERATGAVTRKTTGEETETHYEIDLLRKDGSPLHVEISSRVVYDNGEIAGSQGLARDISGRRHAEQALRESQARNQALLQAFPDFVLRVDSEGTILDFRPPAGAEGWLPPEQAIGKNIRLFMEPNNYANSGREMARAFDTGELVVTEYESQVDGEQRFFERRIVAAGENEIVVFVRDITERYRMEAALAESEMRSRALVQAFPDFVFRARADGTIVDYHAGMEARIARQPQDVIGKNFRDIDDPSYIDRRMETIRRALETRQPVTDEFHVTLRGEERYFESRTIASGEDEVVVFSRDATQLRRAEQAARRSEANYRAIVEQSRTGFWILDRDNDGDFRYSYVNPAWARGAAGDGAAAVGKRPGEEGMPNARERDVYYRQALATGKSVSYEMEYMDAGNPRVFESQVIPVAGPGGEIVRIIGQSRDITRYRLAERELKKRASEQQTLYELAASLQHSAGLDDVCDRVVAALRDIGGAPAVAVRFLTPGGNLDFTASEGLSERYRQGVIQLGRINAGRLDVRVVQNVSALEPGDRMRPLFEDEDIGACLIVPLVVGETGEEVGVVSLYWHEPTAISKEFIRTVRTVAGTTALAISRWRSEEALRKSEDRYRWLVEGSPDWVWVLDREDTEDYRVTYVNTAYFEATGRNPAEVVGGPFEDVVGERLRPRLREAIVAAESGGTSVSFDWEYDAYDLKRQIVMRANSVPSDRPGVTRIVLNARDVTAERESQAMITRLGHILDRSSDEVLVFDSATSNFVQVNGAAVSNLGYTQAEFERLTPDDLLVGMTRQELGDLLHPITTGEDAPVEFECTLRRKDGSTYLAEATLRRTMEGANRVYVALVRDITERRRAELALRESEERFRAIFAAAPEAVAIVGLEDQRYLDVNDRFYDFSGYTRDEVVGKTWNDIPLAPDPGVVAPIVESLLRDRATTSVEVDFTRKGGELRQSDVTISLVELAGQMCVLVLARDITERKRRDKAISLLAAVVDSSEDPIFTVDLDGRIENWNAAAERLFGWAAAEVVGREWSFILSPTTAESCMRKWESIKQGQTPPQEELPRRTRSGEEIELLVSAFPVRDREGVIVGAAAIHRDLRELKAAQGEAARLALVVESSEDAMITFDLEGRVTSMNRGACRLFGYEPGELIGEVPVRLTPPDKAAEAWKGWSDLLRGANHPAHDTVRLHKNGDRIDVSLASFPIRNGNGVVTGYASIARDIRDRIRGDAERAMLAALVESSDDAIIATDLQGYLVSWNAAAANMFGYSAEEVLGKSPAFGIPTEDMSSALELWKRCRSGEAPPPHEMFRVTRDGRRIEVSASAFPVFGRNGQVVAIAEISRDVTEQKLATRRLLEAEAQLRSVAENAPVMLTAWDAEGTCTLALGTAWQTIGVEASALVGRNIDDISELDSYTAQQIHRAMHGDVTTVQTHLRGRVFDSSFSPLGNGQGVVAIALDVTDRVLAEQARREAEAMIQTIAENAPVILFALDTAGTYLLAEGTALGKVVGAGTSIVGASVWDVLPDDELLRRNLRRALAGDAVSYETQISGIDFEVHHSPLRDITGRVTGSVGVAVDVSERMRAERARRQAEALVHDIAASAPVALFAINGDGRLMLIEGKAVELAGVDPAAVVGKKASEILNIDQSVLQGFVDAYYGKDETFEVELNGRHFQVHSARPTESVEGGAVLVGVAVDVTEQHQAQLARQEAEERLRAVATNAPILLFAVDREGTLLLMEGAGLERAGIDRERIVGANLLELPHYEGRFAANTRRALRGEAFTDTIWFGDVAFEAHHAPVFDADGEITGYIGVAVDVTARLMAEEQRQQAEDRLRSFLENAPLVLFVVDNDGNYVFREGRDLHERGQLPGDRVGENAFEIFKDNPQVVANMRRALAGERFSDVLYFEDAYREVHYNPMRDADGNVTGYLGVSVDVSDRLKAEEGRRLAEERLRSVASLVPVVLFSFDTAGTITFAEGAVADRLLPLIGDVRGGSLFESFAEWPEIEKGARLALQGERANFTVAIAEMTLEIAMLPLRAADGSITGVAGVGTDITERVRAEDAIQQAQKLESLAVLAGGIAHDFNNLLVGILGNAGLALAELPSTSPARETIEDIETAGRRAAELARQMLAYSGRGRFVVQAIDLSSLVQEMGHLLRAYTHRAVTRFELAEDLPSVEADATQIRQVVMNLVINAADAIGDGDGVIAVRTGTMYADRAYLDTTYLPEDREPGDYVYLEVTDTGSGMDAETLARIFDPFFTTKFTGKGLGLAAVLGIVRGHKGAIRVESEPGVGTTFRLLLPASKTVPQPAEQEKLAEAWRGTGTVLVVDDEAPVRSVATRALETVGFTVLQAEDGIEGVEAFERERDRIVAVLVDITMPRLGGEGVRAYIRDRDANLPIVFMSGYHADGANGEMLADGTFIQKPFDINDLREALRNAIQQAAGE